MSTKLIFMNDNFVLSVCVQKSCPFYK